MATDEAGKRSWAELSALYEHTTSELEVATLIVQTKIAAGVEPTLEELVRLQNAHAERERIARLMRERRSEGGD